MRMGEARETRYARSPDGLYLAYQVSGAGDTALIEVTSGTLFSVDSTPEQPLWRRYVDHLEGFSRLIRFDHRGIGLSDPLRSESPPTVEQWASDIQAVLDAEQVTQAAVLGVSIGGLGAIFLAASHPERVSALVLVNAYARLLRSPDYSIGVPGDLYQRYCEGLVSPGAQENSDDLPLMAPRMAGDSSFADWWRQAGHRGASPATALAIFKAAAADVRPMLRAIRAPTLVIHSRDNAFVRVGHGQYLAEHIGGSRYVELDGADHVPWVSESDVAGEIEDFLTGARRAPETHRYLATVLFTDIVGSTEQAAFHGDGRWTGLLELHDEAVERELTRFGGRLVKTTGDGALATFDGPARGIHCAIALRDAVRHLGLELRAGLHTGEIESRGEDIAGIGVHLAQRVESLANPGEVLVSRTVADLVVGSGIEFEDRGDHELKGVPGRWQLFGVIG